MKIKYKDLLENYTKLSEEASRGMSRDRRNYDELYLNYLKATKKKPKRRFIQSKSPRV